MTSVRSLKRQKNSLVRNLNIRRKSGASRSKSRSTVSERSYSAMRRRWSR